MSQPAGVVRRYEMVQVTRCGEGWQELQPDENGDWMEYDDHKAAIDLLHAQAEALATALQTIVTIRNDPHALGALGKCTDMWRVADRALGILHHQEGAIMTNHGPALVAALKGLYGQVAQAKEGFGIYCNSPSMADAMRDAEAVMAKLDQEATCQT